MNGFQLSFLTEQSREIEHQPAKDWLLEAARTLGISGCTVFSASESFGAAGRRHSAGFFELNDQPLEVVMAVTATQAEQLFSRLDALDTRVFYIKTPIEYGELGKRGRGA